MQVLTEKRFTERALRLVLFLCVLPQCLRLFLNFFLEYEILGNLAYPDALVTALTLLAECLGTVSIFAGITAVVYTVFLYGLRAGGEWILALIGAYGLAALLLAVVEEPSFGVIVFTASAAVTIFALFLWLKGCFAPTIAVIVTLFLPTVGGLVIVLTTTVPSVDSLFLSILYALISIGYELLVLAVAARLASFFRARAIEKGGKSADISIGKRVLPKGNPVLTVLILVCTLYTLILCIDPLLYSIESISEYGWPVNAGEWFSLFSPYLERLIFFIVGYVVMLFTAGRMETAFLHSQDEGMAMEKYQKKS
ncbi:MAG: hypothetical protein E7618_06980 [Ruminococcaceae bacterium]|nr:hypothetical protein [Oscillospiraceae bacterium]